MLWLVFVQQGRYVVMLRKRDNKNAHCPLQSPGARRLYPNRAFEECVETGEQQKERRTGKYIEIQDWSKNYPSPHYVH